MPYQDVARLPYGGLGGGQVGGAAAQGAPGLGGGAAGRLQGVGVGLRLLRFVVGLVAQQVAQERGQLVEGARGVLGGAVRPQEVRVGGAGRLQLVGTGGEAAGGRAQQGLGLPGVGGDRLPGQFGVDVAVRGGEPFGLAAQPAQLLAGLGRPGLQQLDECLGAGRGGLAGRAVGALWAVEELGGAGADPVGEAVQFGEGGALVALGPGLLGTEVGSDAHLLVQL